MVGRVIVVSSPRAAVSTNTSAPACCATGDIAFCWAGLENKSRPCVFSSAEALSFEALRRDGHLYLARD